MKGIKVLILVSQLGRVWAKGFTERRLFQSLTAVGFFMMFVKKKANDEEREEFNDFNNRT